jgi:hypothetical protein
VSFSQPSVRDIISMSSAYASNWVVLKKTEPLLCIPESCIVFSSFPATGLDRPLGFQEGETPEFLENGHYEGGKVVSPTHQLSLPPGKIPGTHFC